MQDGWVNGEHAIWDLKSELCDEICVSAKLMPHTDVFAVMQMMLLK